jgi:Mg-chelatase subunit ChlI
MNPEEGDLRPQLLDRFALSVEIHGLAAPADRMAIMERTLAFESDPEGFRAHWMPKETELGDEIEKGRELVDAVEYSKRDLHAIAALTSSLQVDGHRADLVILKAARAHAALHGRQAITDTDIALAAELALPHRVKRGPFQQAEVNLFDLEERIEQTRSEWSGSEGEPQPAEETGPVKKNRA